MDKVKANVTSYCVENLVEGNEYFFRVFAENDEGLSTPLESTQSVTPRRPPGCWNDSAFMIFFLSFIYLACALCSNLVTLTFKEC